MDSNAHSELYGVETNSRGEDLESFIINNALFVENVGTEPTFAAMRGERKIESIIDVTISRGLSNMIQDWRVSQEFNGSDHNTIEFTLKEKAREMEEIRLWDNANWLTFKMEMGKKRLFIPAQINNKKLDKMVDCLYKAINSSLDIACLLYTSPSPRD